MPPTSDLISPEVRLSWKGIVAKYTRPDQPRSWKQLATSLIPYFILWGLMVWALQLSYWLSLLLAIPAAAFLVRVFIIFHDCGHGSLFKSQRLNVWVGRITGVMTLTPFYHWTRDHAIHHATAGDLDRRGVGDVITLTVQEYQALPWWKRLGYRIVRHPLFLFPIGAPFTFIVSHRFVMKRGASRKEHLSVLTTNAALVLLAVGLALLLGWKQVLLVQLPIMWLASMAGVWLFYVQHQYQGVYWARHNEWDYLSSAMLGASYYRLPRLLQWFTGNIGFHHLHHMAPRIPNYRLETCYNENPSLSGVQLTLRSSLACMRLALYDEQQRCMVSFSQLRRAREKLVRQGV